MFRIFDIFKINDTAPFYKLFIERPLCIHRLVTNV